MNKKMRKDVALGSFIVLGFALFIGIIYYIGGRQQLFGDRTRISTVFKTVSGLLPGNNVRFSGIKVGTVEQVEIISDSSARVVLLIDKEASRFIKKDAEASIESDGLMGNKIVSISPGTNLSPAIKDGDKIGSREPAQLDDVISSFKSTSDNARELTENLTAISRQIKNSEGFLGKILSDTVWARNIGEVVISLGETGKNTARITEEIKQLTRQINQGNGLLSKAVYNEQWAERVNTAIDSIRYTTGNLAEVSMELKKFTEKLNNGEGALNKLLVDTTMAENMEKTLLNIERGTRDLDEVIETINESWVLNLFSKKDKGDKARKPKVDSQKDGDD